MRCEGSNTIVIQKVNHVIEGIEITTMYGKCPWCGKAGVHLYICHPQGEPDSVRALALAAHNTPKTSPTYGQAVDEAQAGEA